MSRITGNDSRLGLQGPRVVKGMGEIPPRKPKRKPQARFCADPAWPTHHSFVSWPSKLFAGGLIPRAKGAYAGFVSGGRLYTGLGGSISQDFPPPAHSPAL